MTKGNRIYSGWNTAGVVKYNEFVEFVRQDREEDGGVFEDAFKQEMRKEQEDRMFLRNNVTLPNDDIVCKNDLDSKLAGISKMKFNRDTSKSYVSLSSNDNTSMSSRSTASASSYHSALHYETEHSGTYFEAL